MPVLGVSSLKLDPPSRSPRGGGFFRFSRLAGPVAAIVPDNRATHSLCFAADILQAVAQRLEHADVLAALLPLIEGAALYVMKNHQRFTNAGERAGMDNLVQSALPLMDLRTLRCVVSEAHHTSSE